MLCFQVNSLVEVIFYMKKISPNDAINEIIWLEMWLCPHTDIDFDSPCYTSLDGCVQERHNPLGEALELPSNLQYKAHPIPKHKCLSSRLEVVFSQSIEARCQVEKDVVGAAPTGAYPTTSEWSTILLSTKVFLILKIWLYNFFTHPLICLFVAYDDCSL